MIAVWKFCGTPRFMSAVWKQFGLDGRDVVGVSDDILAWVMKLNIPQPLIGEIPYKG